MNIQGSESFEEVIAKNMLLSEKNTFVLFLPILMECFAQINIMKAYM